MNIFNLDCEHIYRRLLLTLIKQKIVNEIEKKFKIKIIQVQTFHIKIIKKNTVKNLIFYFLLIESL